MSALYNIQLPTRPTIGSHHLRRLPILVLNIHTQCNCRCVMCDIWKRKDGRSLTLAQLLDHRHSIVDLGVEQVVLTGGEPLLNREFGEISAFFKNLDVRITLLTTGLLLAKKADVVAQYVDDVIVSIDGPPQVHDKIRGVSGAFEKIRAGLELVRAIKSAMPISCRTTVQRANHAHLRGTVDAAKSLHLSSISFLAADLSSSAFNRDKPWDHERQEEIALTGSEILGLEEELEMLITHYGSDMHRGFIVESKSKLRLIATRYREHLEGTQPTAPLCNAPWKSAVIEVDGSLRPCFFHPIVANIHQATLAGAINTPLASSFRANLDVATNPTCQRCVCSLNLRESRTASYIE